MKNANFIAFDFETATKTGRMPCQIGVVVVKEGIIADSFSKLIRPPQNRYTKALISIHGITPEQTKKSPSFAEVWNDIRHLFEANFIVAHNISFDLSVLEKALRYYELPMPVFMGIECTYQLTRKNLKDCCETLNIILDKHHDAACDALACAKIFLKYLSGETVIEVIEDGFNKEDPHVTLKGKILKKDLDGANPNHPFYDKRIVITGVFEKWGRYELAKLLKGKGADIQTSVSDNIDFIAIGGDPGPVKIEKVRAMIDKGHKIIALNEKMLTELLEYNG